MENRSNQAPYISVVIAARNDNHGGNMLGRMQACVDSWIYQAKRLNLDSELIVVDWNPPAGRPKLVDDLRWPDDCSPVAVRFIEVSPELHKTFANPAAIPLQQMIAKNVGIRRARGQYIVATNLDIIFSAELMEFLAARTLEPGAMYRMDRHDIAMGIPNYAPVDELLQFANSNMQRVFAKEGGFELTPDGRRKLEMPDVASSRSGLGFGPGWYPVNTDRSEIYRWMETEAELSIAECPAGSNTLFLDLEPGPSAGPEPLPVEFAGPEGEVLASAIIRGRARIALNVPASACPITLRVRPKGPMLPLTKDMRFLQLRILGAEWKDPGADDDLVFRTGRFHLKVSDEAGAVLLQTSSDRFTGHLPGSGRLRLDLRLGDGKPCPTLQPAADEWSARVLLEDPGNDWTASTQHPAPRPELYRKAAYLHTNACGDFTLLSRDDWFAMRAYAEFPIWPTHLDSLFCYAAFHAGIREVILEEPMRIFHVEHFAGAGWTPEGDDELNARIARKGVTLIPYAHFVEWVDRMRRFDSTMVFTRADWGLAGVELPETVR